jgi:hypothetical protein
MKISKSICQKCVRGWYHIHNAVWGEEEEEFWNKNGESECPLATNPFIPPDECPYILEHTLMSEEK